MKDKKRTFAKLNPLRRKLLKALPACDSIGEAGRIAGYAQPQNANRAIQQMRPLVMAALEKRGWDVDQFVDKYLVPMLQAKKTIFAQHEGIFTDSRTTADNGSRISAADQYLKVLGLYAPVQVEHSGSFVHILTPQEKREAEETVKRLLAYDSNSTNPIAGELE
jgi:hypothetical protein